LAANIDGAQSAEYMHRAALGELLIEILVPPAL